MTDLSDAEKLETIKGLAEWAGWTHQVVRPCWGLPCYRSGPHPGWNPFDSLDDAHLLLVECNERGLLLRVVCELLKQTPLPNWCDTLDVNYADLHEGIAMALLITPKQITLAVWEVVKGLEQGKDND